MPDREPRPRLGGRRACLTACGATLVLYDGEHLWHRPQPLIDPKTQAEGWRPLPSAPPSAVVALAAGPDLNHHHEQLYALTEDGALHSWSRRPDPDGRGSGWVGWPVEQLGRPTVALAGWSAKPGHQELVAAGADGALLGRRRLDWSSDTGWQPVGVAPQAVALDAVIGPREEVELYLLTAEGELKIKRQRPDAGSPGRWSGVETVAGWAEPAVATTTWTIPGDIQHQAVLLQSGVVHQRWRQGPSPDWSEWWTAPGLRTADGALTALPAALAGSTEPAPAAGRHGQQFLAALIGRETVVLRRWTPRDGWQPWEPPLPAPIAPAEPVEPVEMHADPSTSSGNMGTPTEPVEAHADPSTSSRNETTHAEPVEAPTLPATWWETGAESPTVAVTAPTGPRDGPGDGPGSEPTTRSSVRTDGATVLFTGRELLPLLPGDPATIGSFKLQRRVAGGQRGTDKFVARDGRGYCFLKVLRPEATDDEVTAFRRESAIAQRVTNRHRLATYIDHREVPGEPPGAAGGPGEPPFLALSFVPGRHLAEVVKRRPLATDDLLRLARSLLEALDELRSAGIIHADLKPANVIMRDDHYPVLVDFGSAVPADTTMITEAAFGTTGYAPPELTERRATGPGTDVYGWGAVMITAATGQAPASDPDERGQQLGRLPASLRSLVSAALDDEPANRPELAYARRELSRIVPASDDGLIRDRLPLEVAARKNAPVRLTDDRPRRLTARAAELTVWQYRGALGVAALAGIIVGLIIGTFLITWLRSL